MIHGTCDRRSQRLREALPLAGAVPPLAPLEVADLRGGLSCVCGSLNVGSLNQKEHLLKGLNCDILGLQEVALPPSKWPSIQATLRDHGGTITFSHVNEADRRRRGSTWGVRLGCGLALAAFAPWTIHSLDGYWAADEKKSHLWDCSVWLTAAGHPCIVPRSSAYGHAGHHDLRDPAQRITRLGRACHIIMGDWQSPSIETSLGMALTRLHWCHHAGMQSEGHSTNHPPRGVPRILDDM